ncbi:MAG: SRPBCC domain-containing protein [Lacisediminihabitans sp.]
MSATRLVFEREIGLSPVIVWDALVDQELVSGWLAEARIDAIVGGRFDLVWLYSMDQPPTSGTITELRQPSLLVINTDNRGRIEFRLDELAGGSRGVSTRLRLAVALDLDPAFVARVKANWMISLDQLEQLVRGHPVDWATWDRDHIDQWAGYRDRFSARS